MVKFPSLNLSEIVIILKTEGGSDIALFSIRENVKRTKIFDSWSKIISILELHVVPILARGEDVAAIKPYVGILVREAKVLTREVASVGSIVPGPVGIVCTLIEAVGHFSVGNIPMGLLDLLGCIPGAKLSMKGGSRMAEKIGSRMMVALKKNKDIGNYLAETQLLLGKEKGFNSTVVVAKLNEIRSVTFHDMPNLLGITTKRTVTNYSITEFGSLLIKTRLLFLCFFLMQVSVFAQSPSDIRSYIIRYKQIAMEQERIYGVPAAITLAQGILESGAGRSGLTRRSNNHFGIKKGRGWSGAVCYAWDDDPRKSAFRVYASPEDSYRDHSLFLKRNSRYSHLFEKSVYDYRGWAIGLQKAGYATSPTYARALIGYIDSYRLYTINGGVKLRPGKSVIITKTITREELVKRIDLQIDEAEESEEQESVDKAILHFVVEINEVRCTVLYPGETLSSIAMKYNISKRKLLEYNETTDEKDLEEGDVVFLARKRAKYRGAQDYYRARKGETMYQVSQRFGMRLEALTKLNKMNSFSTLTDGKKVWLK